MSKRLIICLTLLCFAFSMFPGAAYAADIKRLEVTAAKTTLAPGETAQATATLHYTDGSSMDVTDQVTWQSHDETIALVSTTGLITDITKDTVIIDATFTTPDMRGHYGFIIINKTMILMELATKHLGTPYRYGGKSPGGFDSSGFVKYNFSQVGINLPRIAAEQATMGTAVAKEELLPGDLVYFRCGGGGIDHVGIYSGNNQFIHSSSPRSGGVIYSSLAEGYYARSYEGARRIIH